MIRTSEYMNEFFRFFHIFVMIHSLTIQIVPLCTSPAPVDTTVAFPYMSDIEGDDDLVNHPQQPTIDEDEMWIWPGPEGTMKKPVVGNFAVNLVTVFGMESPPYPTKVDTEVFDESMDIAEGDVEDSGGISSLLSLAFSAAILMTSLLL